MIEQISELEKAFASVILRLKEDYDDEETVESVKSKHDVLLASLLELLTKMQKTLEESRPRLTPSPM